MWLVGGPFTSPPLTDCHIGNFGVVQVILLGLNLVAQTFPQAEWAQLLLDARMHSGLWSIRSAVHGLHLSNPCLVYKELFPILWLLT